MKSEKELLTEKIIALQALQATQLDALKQQFETTYQSLRPVNLLKNTLYEVTTSPDIKDNLLNNVIGITTGYLSKKALTGTSHNPLIKLAGSLLQFTIANVVSQHPDTIKLVGKNILQYFFKRKTKNTETT
jgi:hypothetical protein